MTQPNGPIAVGENGPVDGGAGSSDHHSDVDWIAAERSPEFQELVKRKRSFVVPATIFFLSWYTGFVLLAGYAPDFMGSEFLTDGLTVGYVLAFSQFIMVWGLSAWYLRRADRVFDPLAERAAARALEVGIDGGAERTARFDRGTDPAPAGDEGVGR